MTNKTVYGALVDALSAYYAPESTVEDAVTAFENYFGGPITVKRYISSGILRDLGEMGSAVEVCDPTSAGKPYERYTLNTQWVEYDRD